MPRNRIPRYVMSQAEFERHDSLAREALSRFHAVSSAARDGFLTVRGIDLPKLIVEHTRRVEQACRELRAFAKEIKPGRRKKR